MNEKNGVIGEFIGKNCVKDVVIVSFLLVITMANRVSFSPDKKVLTYSPMDRVADLGKTKADILPFGGGASEGSQAFMKKVKELKNRLKKGSKSTSKEESDKNER